MLLSFMHNFIVIFICLIAGILFKKHHHFSANTAQILNAFIIYLSLPALVFSQVPPLLLEINFNNSFWIPVSMAWMTFILSFLFFNLAGKKLGWSQAKIGALILTAGLGNTSFVGFPLLEAMIGQKAIPVGIIVDQPGSFLVLSTLGILAASIFGGTEVSSKIILKRVVLFPPFLALILSIFWALTGLPYKDLLLPSFGKISSTLVPLALFSVGFQLKLDLKILQKRWRPLCLGLFFKLFLMPLFFSCFYIKLLKGSGLSTQVAVIESAMATMITSAVVATEFHLDSEIANLMVGVSIPLSLITVPLWNAFLF